MPRSVNTQQLPVLNQREIKFASLKRLVRSCDQQGISFDHFYRDFIGLNGRKLFLNPYCSDPRNYSPVLIFSELDERGFGSIPEAALNVFWQRTTGTWMR